MIIRNTVLCLSILCFALSTQAMFREYHATSRHSKFPCKGQPHWLAKIEEKEQSKHRERKEKQLWNDRYRQNDSANEAGVKIAFMYLNRGLLATKEKEKPGPLRVFAALSHDSTIVAHTTFQEFKTLDLSQQIQWCENNKNSPDFPYAANHDAAQSLAGASAYEKYWHYEMVQQRLAEHNPTCFVMIKDASHIVNNPEDCAVKADLFESKNKLGDL